MSFQWVKSSTRGLNLCLNPQPPVEGNASTLNHALNFCLYHEIPNNINIMYYESYPHYYRLRVVIRYIQILLCCIKMVRQRRIYMDLPTKPQPQTQSCLE